VIADVRIVRTTAGARQSRLDALLAECQRIHDLLTGGKKP
jgi:hypothetical protein